MTENGGAKVKAVHFRITYKHTDPTDALNVYAEDKLRNCIQKFVHHDTDVSLSFSVEKMRQIAELRMHADGHDFYVKEESEDLYAAVDRLVDNLGEQLRRNKQKLKSHH